MTERRRREPKSEAHAALGSTLREARERAGKTTREVPGYTSGHISNVENGHAVPSEQLLEAYVELGAGEAKLRALLVAVHARQAQADRWRRGALKGAATDPPVTKESTFREIRARYHTFDTENYVRYDADGIMIDSNVMNRVVAVVAPVTLVYAAAQHLGDRRPGVLEMRAMAGCTLVRHETSGSGATAALFELTQPIVSQDGTAEYSYHHSLLTEKRDEPFLRESCDEPRQRQAYRLQFTPPSIPQRVWWFRGTDIVEHADPQPGQELHVDDDGFVSHTFHGVAREILGIAWSW